MWWKTGQKELVRKDVRFHVFGVGGMEIKGGNNTEFSVSNFVQF